MNKKELEIVEILQEECAEVILAVSKCKRFKIDGIHLKNGCSNREHLTEEIGDLQCMIQLMIDYGMIDPFEVGKASVAKIDKLKRWSKIFEEE
jgi:NTP pyrophosphatase (non-canonical NTP hydrolase)